MKKIMTFFKILKMIKQNEKEKNFLTEYCAFCINKQNEYIKINDRQEIEIYNLQIEKTLARIDFLDRATHELKRDARLVR